MRALFVVPLVALSAQAVGKPWQDEWRNACIFGAAEKIPAIPGIVLGAAVATPETSNGFNSFQVAIPIRVAGVDMTYRFTCLVVDDKLSVSAGVAY